MSRAPLVITSLTNDRIKAIRALEMRKARKETGLFVAEGASILMSAAERGQWPETLVCQSGSNTGPVRAYVDRCFDKGTAVLEVSEAVLMKLAAKDNPQSFLGVFRQRWAEPPAPQLEAPERTWIVLEEVRDPGNLGTIIRTADATGTAGVILVGTTCDPFQRECVRATMGSIFAVPLVRMSREAFLGWRADWPGDVVGTHLEAREDFRGIALKRPSLLVMGSEGPGLSESLARTCTRLVRIPMAGSIDSLNLAVATALVLYEMRGAYLAVGSRR